MLCFPLLATASQTRFAYDRTLAVELAVAYVKSHFRAKPEHGIVDIDFRKPVVLAVVAKGPRRMVSVSFSSKASSSGAYVLFEQCESPSFLVVVDEATTENISAYQEQIRTTTKSTFFAYPKVCAEQ